MARLASNPDQASSLRTLIGALLIIFVLQQGQSIFIPISLAVLLSFILTPLVLMLQRRNFSRTTAVLIVAGGALILISAILLTISTQIYDLATKLPTYRSNLMAKIQDFKGGGPSVFDKLFGLFHDVIGGARKDPVATSGEEAIPVKIKEDPTGVGSIISLLALPAINVLASVSLVIALTVSILFKREDLRNRMLRLIGHGHLAFSTQAMDEAATRISRYLLLQLALNGAFGLVFGLGLALIGVPYAFIWAVLAVILRFIPYLGTWLAAAIPLMVSFALPGWTQPILVLSLTIVLGVAANNVLEPLLVSKSTGVSPIALVVAAAFWTWLWGPIGLVLSTPLSVCFAVAGRYVPGLEFLDVLLGTRPALDIQHSYYQRLLAQDEDEASELTETYLQNHPLEELCDDVLIPAMGHLRVDHQQGHIDQELAQYVIETTEEIFEVVSVGSHGPSDDSHPAATPQITVLGVGARGKADTLALSMLDDVLGEQWKVVMMPKDLTEGELQQWLERKEPVAVCIATVAPGGQARVRAQCQRLRKRFPELKIIVGYWGYSEEAERMRERFKRLGADQVVFSLKECRNEMTPFLRSASQRKVLPEATIQAEEI